MLRDLVFKARTRADRGVSIAPGAARATAPGTTPVPPSGGARQARPGGRPAGPAPRALLAVAGLLLALSPVGLRAADAPAAKAAAPVAATPAATAATASKKRYFKAEISWANNTYYTPSNASGHAEFELDVTTHKLRWVLTFKDLSSPPTKVTLHAPAQPGATGAAIMDLAPQGLKSPATGEGQLTDAQVEYLLTGWSYALVTTRKYPQGEARGQLDRVRTPLPAFAQASP